METKLSNGTVLLEHLDTESNWSWCERMAKAQSPEWVIQKLMEYIDNERKRSDRQPLWSKVGDALGQGSGVATAITKLYYPQGGKYD